MPFYDITSVIIRPELLTMMPPRAVGERDSGVLLGQMSITADHTVTLRSARHHQAESGKAEAIDLLLSAQPCGYWLAFDSLSTDDDTLITTTRPPPQPGELIDPIVLLSLRHETPSAATITAYVPRLDGGTPRWAGIEAVTAP